MCAILLEPGRTTPDIGEIIIAGRVAVRILAAGKCSNLHSSPRSCRRLWSIEVHRYLNRAAFGNGEYDHVAGGLRTEDFLCGLPMHLSGQFEW